MPLTVDALASIRSVALPALALGVALAAALARFLRTGMLDALAHDYVRTARAKRLRERVVIGRHAVRNALLSVVTVLGLQVRQPIGGSIVIEQVFTGRALAACASPRSSPKMTRSSRRWSFTSRRPTWSSTPSWISRT